MLMTTRYEVASAASASSIGRVIGGKTPALCSTMSTNVVTTMMTRTPATTAQRDRLFMTCSPKTSSHRPDAGRRASRRRAEAGLRLLDFPPRHLHDKIGGESGRRLVAGQASFLLYDQLPDPTP